MADDPLTEPAPDERDWTWVLERTCPQCGYEAWAFDRREIGAKLRATAAAWRQVLESGDIVTRRPPVPDGASPRWSALEYGCHTRDVYRLYLERLELMLEKDGPTFRNWDQDAAAITDRYRDQDPTRVRYDLAVAAGKLADAYDRVGGKEWDRRGRRADGVEFTVATMGHYLVHDPVHHLWDVEQGFQAIREAGQRRSLDDG
jgi:hypothetical protein